MVRDVGLAEDLAQDALVIALEKWPQSGIPDKPGAWLMAVAKNRALDRFRRDKSLDRKLQEYGRQAGASLGEFSPDFTAPLQKTIDDDVLGLLFTVCHPVLATESRVALTVKLLGGLSTQEIARAYLVTETTMAQRIVRAKRTLTQARVPVNLPRSEDLVPRLASVLEVIYLIFNEGYSATSGEHWTRPALCEESLRLGRILAGLMTESPEVHGLCALMEIQASRLPTRIGKNGNTILLLDQDRAKWDQLLIRRGMDALVQAEVASYRAAVPLGTYALQAEIAACHARANRAEDTDWERIAALYDALSETEPSPVVELNRAMAVSMAYGPSAGLEIADALLDVAELQDYHLLPSVRADLLRKLGRMEEASVEFTRAARLTRNLKERAMLLERAVLERGTEPLPIPTSLQ